MKQLNFKKITAAVFTVAIILYAVYIYNNYPQDGNLSVKCVSKTLFNINCMGCGMNRFVHHLMHFDITLALKYNILGFLIIGILLAFYILYLRWSFFDKPIKDIPLWASWTFLVIAVVYTILRNLPFEALSFFKPPA